MYLLDTNVVSELRRPRPHPAVLAWIRDVAEEDLHVCAVTIGEIQAGIEITREQDAMKAAELDEWVVRVLETYQVLAVDAAAFREWARADAPEVGHPVAGRHDCRGGRGAPAHRGYPQCSRLRSAGGGDARSVHV